MSTWQLFKKAMKRNPFIVWFTLSWWQYLLEKDDRYTKKGYCSKWHRFWCRAAGHPEGPWWHSWGTEPDMSCKGCGDEI